MTQSRQQLVTRALQELRLIGIGQVALSQVSVRADDEVEPLLSDLSERDIWQWGDPDQIDDSAFVHLAKLLANSIAGEFGKPYDDNVRLYSEQRLRELKPLFLSGQPQKTEYF